MLNREVLFSGETVLNFPPFSMRKKFKNDAAPNSVTLFATCCLRKALQV